MALLAMYIDDAGGASVGHIELLEVPRRQVVVVLPSGLGASLGRPRSGCWCCALGRQLYARRPCSLLRDTHYPLKIFYCH